MGKYSNKLITFNEMLCLQDLTMKTLNIVCQINYFLYIAYLPTVLFSYYIKY